MAHYSSSTTELSPYFRGDRYAGTRIADKHGTDKPPRTVKAFLCRVELYRDKACFVGSSTVDITHKHDLHAEQVRRVRRHERKWRALAVHDARHCPALR